MFSPPVLWQINNLAKSLNKKNYKNSIAELHDLIMMHGDEAKIYMISTLLDEIDMKEHRNQGQQKDSQKVCSSVNLLSYLCFLANGHYYFNLLFVFLCR
jgi:hypothetical protein